MSLALIKDQVALNCAQITGIASGALTGTVAKAAGNATITGTGTAFVSELIIGNIVSVPGTATEFFIVSSITDDTHFVATLAAANTAAGQTASRYSIFSDATWRPPTNAECPALVVDFQTIPLNVAPLANALVQYTWNFQIIFILNPRGVGLMTEWLQNIEPFPARLYARFAANNSLGGNATSVVYRNAFRGFTLFNYRDTDYFGFTWDLPVLENVATTFAP